MTTSAANPYRLTEPERCTECGQKKWSKHMERCPGPRQIIAPPPPEPPSCECVGWLHEPTCWLVTDGDAA